jgi:hypothetical protein
MLLALLFAFAGNGAGADGFDAHVRTAKALEGKPEGEAWQKKQAAALGGQMATALQGCITSNAPADKRAFVLVANVDATGRTSGVEVRPATPVATCFSGQFATWALPVPPKSPAPYPIEFDISITD